MNTTADRCYLDLPDALDGEGIDREEGGPLRVAYLVNQYPKVSHSFIRREIQALESQGVEVQRMALRGWNEELADEADTEERWRTRYVLERGVFGLAMAVLASLRQSPLRLAKALALTLRMARRSERFWPYHLAYLGEACRVAQWLRQGRSQHLHAHFGTNSAQVAMLAHVLCGVPYSFTVHGPEEFDKPDAIGLGEKIRHAAFVVAVSAFGRSQLLRWSQHIHWQKLKVVHCGVDRSFIDLPSVPPPAVPRLVCVGRLCEQKGQLLLVEAARRLAQEGVPFEIVLAGDGEMRPLIEGHIKLWGLSRQVRITGWLSGDQVRKEILAARAVVLPSLAEGLPVVLMEAMALRRPVLTTFVAGIPELVMPGENGWLIPAGNADWLAWTMGDCLATSDETLVRMGEAARERVLQRHDAHREAGRLAELFRDTTMTKRLRSAA